MKKYISMLAGAAMLALTAGNAQAAPLQGTVALSGGMDVCIGAVCGQATLIGADNLKFNGESVDSTSGGFSGLGWAVSQAADLADISFNAALAAGDNTAKYLSPLSPSYNWSVAVGNVQFFLTSVTSVSVNVPFLTLAGIGYVSATGYDNTPGVFTFSAQNSGGQANFGFSSSSNTNEGVVPEPTSLFLFGAGLLGLAARRRRAQ